MSRSMFSSYFFISDLMLALGFNRDTLFGLSVKHALTISKGVAYFVVYQEVSLLCKENIWCDNIHK